MNLKERLAEPWELSGIRGEPNTQDEIYNIKGVAFMSCSHPFSRQALKDYINFQSNIEDTIRCPFSHKGEKCNYEWSQEEWRLVAGFSIAEMKKIQ